MNLLSPLQQKNEINAIRHNRIAGHGFYFAGTGGRKNLEE